MSEWRVVTFGNVLQDKVRNGIYKKKEFHGQGCKIVNMGELFGNPRLFDIPMKRVELNQNEKHRFLLQEGDLVFARRSLTAEGAGKCSIIKEINEDTTFESSIIRAKPNHEIVSSDFLYYYFNGRYGKYLIGSILRQVAVAGITGSDLMDLEISIPPLSEQKKLSSVLSSLDDKIDLLYQQNKTLETLADTLFRQWFVEESNDSWRERPLSQTASFLNGLACQNFPPKNQIDKLPVLKIKELRNGITVDSDWASTEVDNKYFVKNGDIIFSWSASLLVKIWNGSDCILNQHLFKVTSEEFPKWFIYQWCKRHLREFISISASHATTMGHIKRIDLDNALTLIPRMNELKFMDNIMAPIFNKLTYNSKQIENLTNQKDLLLGKIMSGELTIDGCKL